MFSNRDLSRLIIPLVLEQIFAMSIGIVDMVMLSSISESAVSGVSLVETFNLLILNVFIALNTGGAVLVAQYLGRKDIENAQESSKNLFFISFMISTIIGLIIIVFGSTIISMVYSNANVDVLNAAKSYLIVSGFAYPFIALYNSGVAIFRAMSNSKVSMYVSLLINIVNIITSYIFIFKMDLGVMGAALGSTISRILGAIIVMCLLHYKKEGLRIDSYFKFKIDKSIIRKILAVGLPNGLENAMFNGGKLIVKVMIAGFATYAIAADAVSNTIAGIQIIAPNAIALAMITIIGRCMGSNDIKQAKYYIKKLMKIAYVSTFIVNIIIFILVPFILQYYNLSDRAYDMAYTLILIHTVASILFWPLSFSLPNAFRASNDAKYTMIVAIISMLFCRVVLSYIFGIYLGYGIIGMWLAMIVDWIIRIIFFTRRYYSNKWYAVALI